MNKTYWLILLVVVGLISMTANIYSFNKLSNEESEVNKRSSMVLSEKEEEISVLKEEIETIKLESKEKNNEETETETEANTEVIDIKEISDLENAAERFIDYTFNVNEENYATVKINAENYMTDEMVETLFVSNGISEDEINLKTSVKNIEVYTANEDEGKAVVQYEINLDYGNGFKENLKPFVLLFFTTENGKLKVSELQAINEIGGI